MTPLVTGVVVAASLLLLLLICCWCLSCSRWPVATLATARSRREKERRRRALAARLAVERGRDTLRSTLARRPRSRWGSRCWQRKVTDPCEQVGEGEEGPQPRPLPAYNPAEGSRGPYHLTRRANQNTSPKFTTTKIKY